MHESSREVIVRFSLMIVFSALSLYGLKKVVEVMDPFHGKKQRAKEEAQRILRSLGIDPTGLDLNEYEESVARDVLHPDNIETNFGDIAGLDHVIESMKYKVILPLTHPELFKSELRRPPRGVLFHGPPGCGKTLLAKAIAKEAGVRFINLSVANLTDKYYGESQKLAHAVFSLARKIQPCIIFIDEIDSFLRSRDSHDHEATAMLKAQFMSLWDGLLSSRKSRVVIIGATNRPYDLDSAVLRRMPTVFQIDLPKEQERAQILQLLLKNEELDGDVDLSVVARETDGFSGSELQTLCCEAAITGVQKFGPKAMDMSSSSSGSRSKPEDVLAWPKIKMDDLISAKLNIEQSKRGMRQLNRFALD
ncbi:outer mitochondrial transmembrane helix translocase-like [Brevipalpus obovatus]|uniref:outer mitochondrial transmembrane helix translocase-like n=1 Tax=Brevipalpus obovatus TaxID=246614 RepID=UPI003D9EA2DF